MSKMKKKIYYIYEKVDSWYNIYVNDSENTKVYFLMASHNKSRLLIRPQVISDK